ncbi:MAG: carboxypeptidase T [Patiriisocius sp.]|jgi:carboxypeptidase T
MKMKKTILSLLLICSTINSFSQSFEEQFQRAKIYYTVSEDLSHLESLGVAVDHGTHKKGYFIVSEFSTTELDIARANGFKVDVLIEDAKEHFLLRNNTQAALKNLTCGETEEEYQTPVHFNDPSGSMGGYFTYQEVLDELDQMKALYPNLITTKDNISTFLTQGQPDNSVSPSIGGNGIKWVKISDNPDTQEAEPQLLYTAIHHAREPMSLHQLIFYMWYLLENYETDAEVKGIVDNSELYFVPVVNPDGYLYNEKTDPNGGGFWRKNRRNNGNGTFGVDNNRNYEFFIDGNPNNGMWGGEGSSGNPDSQVYRGAAPFSEVENQAMKWFVEQHNFVMAFNNHSYGDLLLRPFGYAENTPSPDEELLDNLGAELVSDNGFNNILSAELYPAAGDSDDFMYGTVGTHDKIYAYTPEIGPEFWPPSNQIEPIAKSMMYHNLTSAKMVNNFASLKDTAPLYTGTNPVNNAPFDIKRFGLAGEGNFTVTLNPVSTNIEASGDALSFSGLALLETQSGNIQYTLGGSVASGDAVAYELIVNNGVFNTSLLVTKVFGSLSTIFEDDASTTSTYSNNGWATTTQTYVSSPSSITESPNGDYNANANKSIVLNNTIDLSGVIGANVTFWTKFDIENNYDYAQFQISVNGGDNWIPQCGLYTNAGSSDQPEGQPLYDGSQDDWVQEQIDLSDYIGETITVRFIFRSDNFASGDGFYFDDLTFNTLNEDTLSIEDQQQYQFGIYPNPVKNILHITTALNNYTASIYTIQGRRIKTSTASGNHSLDYSALASGVYILKLTEEGTTQTFKIIKE